MPKRTIMLTAVNEGADAGFKCANKLANEGSHSKLEASASEGQPGYLRVDISDGVQPTLSQGVNGKWFLTF